jgi:hypothetical protein
MGELNAYSRTEHEDERAAAEVMGLLDHIIPDLRPLAIYLDWLNLDPTNAQEHDPRNINVIAGSLQAYGQRTPLTVNFEDEIIANRVTKGNGTYTAAKMLGWVWIAVVGTSDRPDDAMGYGMLDNRSSALSRPNYRQTSNNVKQLKEAGHPILELMYEDDEVLPLLFDEYETKQETDEVFDASMLRGRAISKITASERLVVDQAIELKRAQHSKNLTEGAALEMICKAFLDITAVYSGAVSNNGNQTDTEILEEEVLPM